MLCGKFAKRMHFTKSVVNLTLKTKLKERKKNVCSSRVRFLLFCGCIICIIIWYITDLQHLDVLSRLHYFDTGHMPFHPLVLRLCPHEKSGEFDVFVYCKTATSINSTCSTVWHLKITGTGWLLAEHVRNLDAKILCILLSYSFVFSF